MSRKVLGDEGEKLAARYLEGAGWTILDRNFRLGHKEIDLVAWRAGVVSFVEVKTRSGTGFGHPLDAITPKKRGEIRRVAEAWIQRFGRPGFDYRFDAIAIQVSPNGSSTIEHVEDAWQI